MIQLNDVSIARGTKVLLQHVNLTIQNSHKIGICGINGSGKTTLFALLLQQLSPESGSILQQPKLRIAHLAQQLPHTAETALAYVLAGDAELLLLQNQLHQAERESDGLTIAAIHDQLHAIDAYRATARASEILAGLGFTQAEINQPVNYFSGGMRMRFNLARLLMSRADLLALDEPTNHLDLPSIIWLEQWLRKSNTTQLIISHDRDFLDHTVDFIAHLHDRTLQLYRGNYSAFEALRAAHLARQQALYQQVATQKAHMQQFIDRFRAKATKARQAQSRMKALSRLPELSAVHSQLAFQFQFKEAPSCGNPLLTLRQVSLGYDNKPLLQQINLTIEPQARIALLGANGTGKSTLIKCLVGELPPLTGDYWRQSKLRIGYFAQHQLEQLHLEISPLQHLQAISPEASEQSLRNFLGQFQFRDEMATKSIQHFSGGEKARLVLAMLVWQAPNLLLLDEPTNHLDLEMRQALELALQSYQGALILVAHDRHLLRTTADEFWLVRDGSAQPFDGDLDDYEQWLLQYYAAKAKSTGSSNEKSNIKSRQDQKDRRALTTQLKKIEASLTNTQQKISEINQKLGDVTLYQQNKGNLLYYQKEHAALNQQIKELEQQWLEITMRLEEE